MRKQLSTLFNKAVHAVRKPVIAIAAALAIAFTPSVTAQSELASPPAQEQSLTPTTPFKPNYTYWRYGDYDVVAKVWEDENNKLCAVIHSADPADPDNKMLMAKLKGYATSETHSLGGNQIRTVWKPAPQFVKDSEITSFVGYQPDLDAAKKREGKWKGKITSPFNFKTYGLDIEKNGENELKLSGYFSEFPLLKLSITAERISDPTLPPLPTHVVQKNKAPKII